MRWLTLLLLALTFAVTFVACKKLEPPTFKPQGSEIIDSDKGGLIIRVHGMAHNPNGVALPIKSVMGSLSFEKVAAADVSTTSSATLAASADTEVAVDIKATWAAVAAAVGKAGAGAQVNYTVAGTASVGEEGQFTMPFSYSGQVEKKLLALAALRHIGFPWKVPGLPVAPPAHSSNLTSQ